MRRCFTDPHYWKNPALRRSREKGGKSRENCSFSRISEGTFGSLAVFGRFFFPSPSFTAMVFSHPGGVF